MKITMVLVGSASHEDKITFFSLILFARTVTVYLHIISVRKLRSMLAVDESLFGLRLKTIEQASHRDLRDLQ